MHSDDKSFWKKNKKILINVVVIVVIIIGYEIFIDRDLNRLRRTGIEATAEIIEITDTTKAWSKSGGIIGKFKFYDHNNKKCFGSGYVPREFYVGMKIPVVYNPNNCRNNIQNRSRSLFK